MNNAFATLRKPDASDIEAIREALEDFADRMPSEEANRLLAAGLRARLKPEAPEHDDTTSEAMASTTPVDNGIAHHFTLPEHLGQGQLRSVVRESEPWFVAADVCAVLGLGNTAMTLDRLDEDERGVSSIDTPGGAQEMSIINTSGLFSLILTSRKPQAKPFKRWVTHEVLPSIARTGGYQDDSGAMEEHLRAATDGYVGVAPKAPTAAAPALPPDLQMLLSLVLPLLAGLAPHLQDWLAAWLDKRTRALLPRNTPAYTDLPFFDLLKGQCKLRGRTAVARELGVSLPQISQVLNFSGAYGDGRASPHTLSDKVLAAYGCAPQPSPTQTELPV
jgi:hypothetical protein